MSGQSLDPLYADAAISSQQSHFVETHRIFADDHPVIIACVSMVPGTTLLPHLAVIEVENCFTTPASEWLQNCCVKLFRFC